MESGHIPTASPAATRDEASSFAVQAPKVELPKGGGAIRGIGEKFAANPVNGTASMSVPLATSPGRSGFGPQLALSYDSGAGNGPFGFGWSLALPNITRKTDKGLPQYLDASESDVFLLSGAEDLVPKVRDDGSDALDELPPRPGPHGKQYRVRRYRPRIEGLFARIERWTEVDPVDGKPEVLWRSISGDNVTSWYGLTSNSRIADPDDASRVFSWLLCYTHDDKGNAQVFDYVAEDSRGVPLTAVHERHRTAGSRSAQRYLRRIRYGNRRPNRRADDSALSYADVAVSPDANVTEGQVGWLFSVVLEYGGEAHLAALETMPATGREFISSASTRPQSPWIARDDAFSTYRAGFEVRTYRRCVRALMFHHFAEELGRADYLVRSTDFQYEYGVARAGFAVASYLASVTHRSYRVWDKADARQGQYFTRAMPPVDFEYSRAILDHTVRDFEPGSLDHLAGGSLAGVRQWVDLDGEGLIGLLAEQGPHWYYARNVSANKPRATLEAPRRQPNRPNASLAGGAQLLDVAGDGQQDVVVYAGDAPGFAERRESGGWESPRSFRRLPRIDWSDPGLRFVDVDGDGRADILITEDDVFVWYRSLGEDGFETARVVARKLDEEKGPRVVFADAREAVLFADFSGDGQSDIVRVRHNEVVYWPHLGHANFAAKVTMARAPRFDYPDQFDPRRLHAADVDGSGATDLLYSGADGVHLYRNLSGNAWADGERLEGCPPMSTQTQLAVLDLMGTGTACAVWSSVAAADRGRSVRYIDLMGGQKPHLMITSRNNLGAETTVEYKPSTYFYLEDEKHGRPWITRLPFPVHVVHRAITRDLVSRNRFVSRFAYHHGYFDGAEREFRGFGMVEQWDTDSLDALHAAGAGAAGTNIDASNYVPPAHTKTWYHTGAYLGGARISSYLAGDPSGVPPGEYYREPGLTPQQWLAQVLPDTVLPAGLTFEEEREAARSLRGSMLRQEVYSDDGSARAAHPYTVVEQNFTVKRLQPKGHRRHAVFLSHGNESRTYHYEREPRDPRIQQALTLEVDRRGRTRKQVAIGYGRLQIDPDLVEPDDHARQRTPLITYTETGYTDPIDPGAADDHRLPLVCSTRTFELTRFAPAGGGTRFFAHGDFVQADPADPTGYRRTPLFDGERGYHETAAAGRERRLIEDLRTLFRRDDLTGLLPLGTMQRRALAGEAYRLALTPGLIDLVFRRPRPDGVIQTLLPDPNDVLGGVGRGRGGYVDLDGNGNWWIPSGRALLSPDGTHDAAAELNYARQHFYLPCRYRDPFYDPALRNESIASYDRHDLLLAEARDALGNRMTIGARTPAGDRDVTVVGNDYRVLQPHRVMDPNRNEAAAAFDIFGFVAGTAVSGKPEEALGDTLAGFEADLDLPTVASHLGNPLAAPRDVLAGATMRTVYDVEAFRRGGPALAMPSVVMTIARETHTRDPGGATTRVRINLAYSDGFGREIQLKAQAEPGPLVPGGPAVSPRWAGSGWVVHNNKGKPVRQFEPFFSATPAFQFGVQAGVSPIVFYDPLNRVIATLRPDHTYQKVVFSQWRHATYDANDTCAPRNLETGDPRTDPHVGPLMAPYFAALNDPGWQTWRARRASGGLGDAERKAAEKAAAHADTPGIAYLDTLGRVFLTHARNRVVCPGHPLDGTSGIVPSRIELDIEGNQRSLRDAVVQAGDPRGRVVVRYQYDLLGSRIHQISMEAGARWMLNDVAGNPLRSWDSRGHQTMAVYDVLRRPTEELVQGAWAESDPDTLGGNHLVTRIEYGESHPQAEALNLRTRVFRHFDSAGVIVNVAPEPGTGDLKAFDFKGNPLRKIRQFVRDYQRAPDWLAAPVLEPAFVSAMRYDAMNRPVQSIAPYSAATGRATIHVVQCVFNEASLLDRVDVWLRRAQEPTALLDPAVVPVSPIGVANIDYDEKGRRRRIVYSNGVSTDYDYDAETYRLTRLRTGTLQDLSYTCDPAGNVVRIADAAQQSTYFRNNRIDPSQEFTYDALYRLIEATGREHLGQGGQPFVHSPFDGDRSGIVSAPGAGRFGPNDRHAMGGYLERYHYDPAGNFVEMQHVGTDPANPGWTRAYRYEAPSLIENGQPGTLAKTSNRLTRTIVSPGAPNPLVEDYSHDPHGSMVRMPHLGGGQPGPAMEWNHRDQLRRVNLGGGGTLYCVYDASGQRVRKVCERSAALTEERIYLGGFEVFRRHAGPITAASLRLERETLHVMDNQQRVGMVELRTLDTAGTDRAPDRQIRMVLSDHLGSSCVELDENADVISYEEYSPYGSTTYQAVRAETDLPKRYRYTGKERDDETGFNYHGARYYAPWLGRWTAADPAGFVDGPNLYAYAKLNPACNSDPSGRASKHQFQVTIRTALEKAQAGNRTAAGTAAEAVLEGMLQKAGYTIIKGPATNPGEHFADIVAYDPETKELLFFDNKYVANKKSVSRADAFVDVHDDAETAARKAGVVAEAQERFQDIAKQLPADQLDDIQKAFAKAAADPSSANFVISNASPRTLKNLVQKVSQRLLDRGVKFADAAGGSKKLKADLDAKFAKGADATAEALGAASSAGKHLVKSLPVIGLGVSAGFAIPRVAQAAEEDLAYEETMRSLGEEEPPLKGLSVLRESAVIGGEEGGGELGGWGGAALGASVSWETGPGVILGTIGGAIIFGVAGDTVGGAAAGFLFDKAADGLYEQWEQQR